MNKNDVCYNESIENIFYVKLQKVEYYMTLGASHLKYCKTKSIHKWDKHLRKPKLFSLSLNKFSTYIYYEFPY